MSAAGASFATAVLRQLRLLTAVQQITMHISSADDVEAAFPELARRIFTSFALDSVGIGTLDDGWLNYQGMAGDVRAVAGRAPADEDLAVRVARQAFHEELSDRVELTYSDQGVARGARLPIRDGEQLLGVLSVSIAEERRLAGDEVDALAQIAAAIGAGLARSQRLTPVRRTEDDHTQARELRLLSEAVAAAPTGPRALAEAVRLLRRSYNCHCSVGLLRDQRLFFSYIDAPVAGALPDWMDEGIPLGVGVTGRVAESGIPALLPDVTVVDYFLDAGLGTRAELCVPLAVGAEVFGVLNLESSEQDFDDDDLELLSAVGTCLGLALDRERAHQLAAASRLRLELVEQLGQVLGQAPSPAAALELLPDQLARQLGAAAAVLYLRDGNHFTPYAASAGVQLHDLPEIALDAAVVQRARLTQRQVTLHEFDQLIGELPDGALFIAETWVVITSGDGPLGLVGLSESAEHRLSDGTRELLQFVAPLLTPLLQAARSDTVLELMANLDPVTGVANQRQLRERLALEAERAQREQQPLSLLAINLDNFKAVNERFGHLIGDTILREIAGRLRGQLREPDLLARYGGDQFVALAPNVGDRVALEIAARLLRALREQPFLMPDRSSLIVTASAGIATLPDDVATADELLHAADLALEIAKSSGRGMAYHYRDVRIFGQADLSQRRF